jgi:hypothetical protein
MGFTEDLVVAAGLFGELMISLILKVQWDLVQSASWMPRHPFDEERVGIRTPEAVFKPENRGGLFVIGQASADERLLRQFPFFGL